jgi:hypothetical protein
MPHWRTWNNNYPDGKTNLQMRRVWKVLREYLSLSRQAFQWWKANALWRQWDASMIFCHLCMHGWLLRKWSHKHNQTALRLNTWSTKIISLSREFIVIAIERPLATLPKDDTCDSVKSVGDSGNKIISGQSSSWNLWRHLGEYELVLPNNYFFT